MRRVWFRSSLAMLVLALAGTGAAEASAKPAPAQDTAGENVSSSPGFSRKIPPLCRPPSETVAADQTRSRRPCPVWLLHGQLHRSGRQNAKACAKLSAAHAKMRANLGSLERKRDSYSTRGNRTAKRRILAALTPMIATATAPLSRQQNSRARWTPKAKSGAARHLVAVLGQWRRGCQQHVARQGQQAGAHRRRTQVERAAATTAPCACAVATAFSSRSPRLPRHRILPVTSAPAR
jgi:hypothetical protein